MSPSGAGWQRHGGDLARAVQTLVTAAAPAALLRVDADLCSLERARLEGMSRDTEARLFARAWRLLSQVAPPEAVGRRSAWTRFEWVIAGERAALEAVGRQVITALALEEVLAALRWHVILTVVVAGDPERTLCCDPGYDLREVAGRSALVWVTPFRGPDWREAQRYPTARWLAVEATAGLGDGAPNDPRAVRARVLGRVAELRHHLGRLVAWRRCALPDGQAHAHADELVAILLDLVRSARDAPRLEVAPPEPPPHCGLLARAAREGLLDPSLASRLEGWLRPKRRRAGWQLADAVGLPRELDRLAIDLAQVARSLELGRTLAPAEASSIAEPVRAALATSSGASDGASAQPPPRPRAARE